MKRIILLPLFLALSFQINAQSLNDYYNKYFDIYTPFSGISCDSKALGAIGFKNTINYWGVLNLGCTYSQSKQWGFSFFMGQRAMGDAFFALKGLLSKKTPRKDFSDTYYLADFGLLPNLRFGCNLFGNEKIVINLGVYHSYYITTGTTTIKNDWLSAGPNIYVDKTITKWLAAKVSSGPMFSYLNGRKIKQLPRIWEHKLELITKFGMFVGLDYLTMSKLQDNYDSDYKLKRYDFKVGFRVHL